eukprot:4260012-Amphidinium_carterae.1
MPLLSLASSILNDSHFGMWLKLESTRRSLNMLCSRDLFPPLVTYESVLAIRCLRLYVLLLRRLICPLFAFARLANMRTRHFIIRSRLRSKESTSASLEGGLKHRISKEEETTRNEEAAMPMPAASGGMTMRFG